MVQDQEDTRPVHSAQVLQRGEAMGCWIFHNWSNPPDRYGCTARVTCLDCGKVKEWPEHDMRRKNNFVNECSRCDATSYNPPGG
jgi:hypothetical protein